MNNERVLENNSLHYIYQNQFNNYIINILFMIINFLYFFKKINNHLKDVIQ